MDNKKLSKLKIAAPLTELINSGHIVSIIQFGSSIRKKSHNDIDLAVIIKDGSYETFLKTVYGEKFEHLDISLLKEEEISGPKNFKWGSHGNHFLYSLINGRTVYGKNPFKKFTVEKYQIKESALDRMYDYIEDVRRAAFCGKIKKSIIKRWPKFIRLSAYLLGHKVEYPKILDLNDYEIKKYFVENNINIDLNQKDKNLLIAYEKLWTLILKKYRLYNIKK